MNWLCTQCDWIGDYKDCEHTIYNGAEWGKCPLCKAVAIPQEERKPVDTDSKSSRFGHLAKLSRPIMVHDVPITVYVTEYGNFVGEINPDDWVMSPTLDSMRLDIAGIVKQRLKKVAVPFCTFDMRNGIRKGTVNGIHALNLNYLVTWDNGEKTTLIRKTDPLCEVPTPEVEASIMSKVQKMNVLIHELHGLEPAKLDSNEMDKRIKSALTQKGDVQ